MGKVLGMAEHTVRSFAEQLEALSIDITKIGGLAETQLADSDRSNRPS